MTDPREAIPDRDIEELSPMRMRVAAGRACRDLGIEYEWGEEGMTLVFDGELDELAEADDGEWMKRWIYHCKTMILQDNYDSLIRKGYAVANGVDENGERIIELTEKYYKEYE